MAGNLRRDLKQLITILLLFISTSLFAQRKPIPKDTSFTIYSSLIKEQKKRPYIAVATPDKPKDVIFEADIPYRDIDGRILSLDVFYPKKIKRKKPAVLLIFGGGWRSGDKTQNYAMAIELAKSGYVAVTAEYRLSLEAPYPAGVYDLKTALIWMRANSKKYGIDVTRIATLGCSAGGQLAALIGNTGNVKEYQDTIGNTDVEAVVDIDGILAFKHPESAESTVAAQWLGGTYEQVPDIWENASALDHVTISSPPILFLNSSLPRFHAGRTDMIHKLDSLNIYSEIHEFPDTPHPFWFFHPWFNDVMKYTIGFLDKIFKTENQSSR